MSGEKSAGFEPLVSRYALAEAFRNALRLYVGRGRRYSVKELSRGIGFSTRLIEGWIAPVGSEEHRVPEAAAILSCMAFLRAEFASDLLSLASLAAVDVDDDDRQCVRDIGVETAEDAARVVRITADDDVCPAEAAEARAVGLRKIERGMQLVDLANRARHV